MQQDDVIQEVGSSSRPYVYERDKVVLAGCHLASLVKGVNALLRVSASRKYAYNQNAFQITDITSW
jgi:hypothetical protein